MLADASQPRASSLFLSAGAAGNREEIGSDEEKVDDDDDDDPTKVHLLPRSCGGGDHHSDNFCWQPRRLLSPCARKKRLRQLLLWRRQKNGAIPGLFWTRTEDRIWEERAYGHLLSQRRRRSRIPVCCFPSEPKGLLVPHINTACTYERGRGTDTNKQTFPGCVLYTRMYVERGRGSFPFVSSPLQRKWMASTSLLLHLFNFFFLKDSLPRRGKLIFEFLWAEVHCRQK